MSGKDPYPGDLGYFGGCGRIGLFPIDEKTRWNDANASVIYVPNDDQLLVIAIDYTRFTPPGVLVLFRGNLGWVHQNMIQCF